ncbi:MAG: dihydrofolate reductase [Methanothrix sp.]|jgi:dihydrofolate reductase/dihydrofolate reductase (trimethoprim resistance protein)|nr:dihydrofolate reductase [Methanothrix sp.]
MIISIIAAMSKNRVIGNGLEIPWKIKGEQKRFKELTIGKTIVMGRKTYNSIGKALPYRTNFVISKSINNIKDCDVFSSLENVIEYCSGNLDELFIIGGGTIYKQALPYIDKIYLTVINKEFNGDVFFPEFEKDFEIEGIPKVINGDISYTYYTYVRKK